MVHSHETDADCLRALGADIRTLGIELQEKLEASRRIMKRSQERNDKFHEELEKYYAFQRGENEK